MGTDKDKFIINTACGADKYIGCERRKHIRFPVCLAVKYGENVPDICADFIMNISKGGLFIRTDAALKVGSRIIMHFYIPPDKKLLAEFEGEVVAVNICDPSHHTGIHVKFTGCSQEDLRRLEEYLDEKRHLIDESA